jgi:hypothetical protein
VLHFSLERAIGFPALSTHPKTDVCPFFPVDRDNRLFRLSRLAPPAWRLAAHDIKPSGIRLAAWGSSASISLSWVKLQAMLLAVSQAINAPVKQWHLESSTANAQQIEGWTAGGIRGFAGRATRPPLAPRLNQQRPALPAVQ